MQACRIGRPRAAGSPQFPHATPRQPRAISPRIASEIRRQDALDKREGAGKAGRWPHPWLHAKKHAVVTTGSAETTRPSPRDGVTVAPRPCVLKSARMCERAVLTNRPSLDLSPNVLKGHRAYRGAWDSSGVFLQPEQLQRFEPAPCKEGSWMMAQNDSVVAGIDVARDKVDVCIRSLSLTGTFASTEDRMRKADPVANRAGQIRGRSLSAVADQATAQVSARAARGVRPFMGCNKMAAVGSKPEVAGARSKRRE
jgi:hypothetical protein